MSPFPIARYTQESRLTAPLWVPLTLPAEAIHVWCVDVHATDYHDQESQWLTCLTMDEQERAQRTIHPMARTLFVMGRCLLGHLLGRYLGISAEKVVLHRTPSGKLFVEGHTLQFNLSHSGNRVACAFSQQPIGLDIEHQRPVLNRNQIAARHFSPDELSTLQRLAPAEQNAAFFRLWTSKESVIKAVGSNVADLSRFTLPAALIEGDSPQKTVLDGRTWWVTPFHPTQGYSGALATPIEHAAITVYDLQLLAV